MVKGEGEGRGVERHVKAPEVREEWGWDYPTRVLWGSAGPKAHRGGGKGGVGCLPLLCAPGRAWGGN